MTAPLSASFLVRDCAAPPSACAAVRRRGRWKIALPQPMLEVRPRKALLIANALFLLVASTGGMIADLAGAFADIGPQKNVLGPAPHAAIGFVEAHGLAFIMGVLLWRADPARAWHLAAAAVHILLGTSNVVFWQIFVASDMLAMGWVTTTLHWLFVGLQLAAATTTYSRHGS